MMRMVSIARGHNGTEQNVQARFLRKRCERSREMVNDFSFEVKFLLQLVCNNFLIALSVLAHAFAHPYPLIHALLLARDAQRLLRIR